MSHMYKRFTELESVAPTAEGVLEGIALYEIETGTINDRMMAFLIDAGYTAGSVDDRYKQYVADNAPGGGGGA